MKHPAQNMLRLIREFIINGIHCNLQIDIDKFDPTLSRSDTSFVMEMIPGSWISPVFILLNQANC